MWFYFELYRKSLNDSSKAIELDPQYTRAYVIKAYALLNTGKKSEAEEVIHMGLNTTGDLEQLGLLLQYKHTGELPLFCSSLKSHNLESRNLECYSSGNNNTFHTKIFEDLSYKIINYLIVHNPDLLNSLLDGHTTIELVMKDIGFGNHSKTFETTQTSEESISKSIEISDDEFHKTKNTTYNFENIETILSSVPVTIQHGVGDISIDKVIALGYWQINTGQLKEGLQTFTQLINTNSEFSIGYIGRGTALALLGKLSLATHDFNKAIEIDPNNVDALKRRGQTLAAQGINKLALKDLDYAVTLSKDFDSYYQRGLVYYKIKNYRKALKDLKRASHMNHYDKNVWNHIAMCCMGLGRYDEAIENYKKTLSIDPNCEEAYSGLAILYKDLAKENEALECAEKIVSMSPNKAEGYYLKNIIYFHMGLHSIAVENGEIAANYRVNDIENNLMLAVGYHDLGLFQKAIERYQLVLLIDSNHFCWYQKEIALFWRSHLDFPLDSYNTDNVLDPQFKESWCKRNPHKHLYEIIQPQLETNNSDVDQNFSNYSENEKASMEFSMGLGCWIHQNASGFMYNRRQIAMAGMAILEMAQTLREVWFQNKTTISGKSSSKNYNVEHKFGWRDFYDIGVKWRQYSEHNDPVYWADLLTEKQFKEGFGAQTPIISGQCPIIRYYPVFDRALSIMKSLMFDQCSLSKEDAELVRKATSIEDLYDVMKKDFFVITPCHSIRNPNEILEGTRLTIQKIREDGYEFSIRTPGTPPRWLDYQSELDYIFEKLRAEVISHTPDMEKITYWILTCTFYWYNFMPLSRGTAIVGNIGMHAMFLACGIHLKAKIPPGVMLDWNAILSPTHDSFINSCKDWIYAGRVLTDTSFLDSLKKVNSFVTTLRELLMCLNYLSNELQSRHTSVSVKNSL